MTADARSRLIELATATDMRFEATKEEEAVIKALAAEVEKHNPTADPARRADLLDGRWRLLYSSFRLTREATLARLAFNKLPAVEVRIESIHQEVDSAAGHYNNLVHFSRRDLRGVQVTRGRFRPGEGPRLEIEFHATDVIADADGAGRATAGTALAAALADALGAAESELRAPLETQGLWSDVTYLDEELRLMRGAYGNLYVLRREARTPVSF